jgi:(2Fe-2S) ferredoxin
VTGRWVLLAVRPTPAGVDVRGLDALVERVAAALPDPVRLAHLDQAEPSVPVVLDQAVAAGVAAVTVVPLALPPDTYLVQWVARTVAHWRAARAPAALDVTLADGLADGAPLADAVAGVAAAGGSAITASPRAFASAAWSQLPVHAHHVLVCRGPRCTAHGAGPVHRALAAAARGTDVLVSPVGCLGPCNLGPLVVEHPAGHWHTDVDADGASALVAGVAERPATGVALP